MIALFCHNVSSIILLYSGFNYMSYRECYACCDMSVVGCIVTLCTNPTIRLWLPINLYLILSSNEA